MTYTRLDTNIYSTNAFTTTNGQATVTITFSGDHGLTAGDIILLDNFSTITNSNYGASDFNDKKFMVTSVDSSTDYYYYNAISRRWNWCNPSGGIRAQLYYSVGPAGQLPGFGWSLGQWGGTVSGEAQTSLNGGINASTTTIFINRCNTVSFIRNKFIQIGSEEISYTGISGNTLTGVTRGVRNTTAASHSNADTVTNSTRLCSVGRGSIW